jgi:hypothetical protein
MSNPTPGTGGSDTANITSNVPSTALTVTAHYKTTSSSYPGMTDSSGSASVTFGIGHPTSGYTVQVTVDISGKAACSTSFTPY